MEILAMKFGGYTARFENDNDAITETRNYLGDENFEIVLNHMRDFYKNPPKENTPWQNDNGMHLMLSFAGVQGYPVNALIRMVKVELGMASYWPKEA